jgi:hypothetical protein
MKGENLNILRLYIHLLPTWTMHKNLAILELIYKKIRIMAIILHFFCNVGTWGELFCGRCCWPLSQKKSYLRGAIFFSPARSIYSDHVGLFHVGAFFSTVRFFGHVGPCLYNAFSTLRFRGSLSLSVSVFSRMPFSRHKALATVLCVF